MSWMTTVSCDGCTATLTDPHEARWMVAMRARNEGWHMDDGFHLCPECRRAVA